MPFNGTNYTDMLEFVYAKIDDQAIPNYLGPRGAGGGWHEGVYYGRRSKLMMLELFLALKNADGVDYFTQSSFPADAVFFHIYSLQPGTQRFYPGGDLARTASEPLTSDDQHVFAMLAAGLGPRAEAQYARYSVDAHVPSPSNTWNYTKSWLAMLHVPAAVSRNYDELPLSYHADGLGFVNSRSEWGPDAVSVSFISTDRIQSHQQQDQNSFVIWKGGWQAIDATTYSQSGILPHTFTHNTLMIGGHGQRYGDGTGSVLKFERGNGYVFVAGEANDAYWAGANEYGHGTEKLLHTFTRELVHILPGYVVVYDRITPIIASNRPTYLLHSHLQPNVSGNLVSSSDGGGRLYNWAIEPTNSTLTPINDASTNGDLNSWRVEVNQPSTSSDYLFLNVLYTTDASDNAVPNVSRITSLAGDMIGAEIDDGANRVVFMFSTDPDLDVEKSSVNFELGLGPTSSQYLFNMLPGAEYAVTVDRLPDRYIVSVSLGEGIPASSEGVLTFELDDAGVRPSALIAVTR